MEKRLEKIEELLNKITDLKPKVPDVNPMALSLAAKGYEPKKSTIPLLERSYSFGMFSGTPEEDNRPDFDFGQTDHDIEEFHEWVKALKTMPPALESHYLQMMSGHPAESSGSSHLVLPPPNTDQAMPTASTAPRFSTNFGIGSISNIIS